MATTTPTPAEQLASDIQSLRSSISSLQSRVKLSSLRDGIEDLETTVTGLGQRIQGLRARSYVFEKGLESQAVDFNNRWKVTKPSVIQQINQQAASLEIAMRGLEAQMAQLAARSGNPPAARPLLEQVKNSVSNLESRASAAESAVHGMYDNFQSEVNTVKYHLDKVDWTLTQVSEASFPFMPTEAVVMAVEATWLRDNKEDKDDPKGVLFLTDQRLLFEQKQEVATKKVLFITTERQKVQQLHIDAPVAQVQSVKASKQGMFKNEDRLEVQFASGAPLASAQFHLFGQDSNLWQGLVNRVKSKEFDSDRAVAIDKAVVEKVKAAPTTCPNCNGAITQVVMRGMDSITCEYCGSVIRL